MQRTTATYADLEALPSHLVGELIAGVLYASPRPGTAHAVAASRLGGELMGPFDRGRGGPGGWVLLFRPELHLDADVLVPDFAGWRRDRMSRPPRVAAFTLAPDWVCELLSPSTRKLDRTAKLPVYARAGVKHVWLMDPEAHTLEVLRLPPRGTQYVPVLTHSGLSSIRAEPFEALSLDMAYLWDEETSEK